MVCTACAQEKNEMREKIALLERQIHALTRVAHFGPLTGLANRKYVGEVIATAHRALQERGHSSVSLLLIGVTRVDAVAIAFVLRIFTRSYSSRCKFGHNPCSVTLSEILFRVKTFFCSALVCVRVLEQVRRLLCVPNGLSRAVRKIMSTLLRS